MEVDITFESETEVKLSYNGFYVYMRKLTKDPGWFYRIDDKFHAVIDLGTLYLSKEKTIEQIKFYIDSK